MNVSMETSVNNDDIIDGGNILNRESLHFMQYISPCHSMINVLSNIRRKTIPSYDEVVCECRGQSHHRLPMMRPEVFLFWGIPWTIPRPSCPLFSDLQHELDIVETKYKLQEKVHQVTKIELKFKNDLAYRKQILEAAEKKRLHSILQSNKGDGWVESRDKLLEGTASRNEKCTSEGNGCSSRREKALEEHLATSRYQNTSLRDQVSDLRDQHKRLQAKQDTSDEILAMQ